MAQRQDNDSVTSISTRGGANFDLLCNGTVQYYTFNLANLTELETADDIEEEIAAKLRDTITALEIGADRKIAKLYIGKAFVPRKKTRGGYMNFDPLDHDTWNKRDICSSWGIHRNEDYGRDGMVVLCAITSDTVPENGVHQEYFTLQMKDRLFHRYGDDPRLVNSNPNAGQRASQYYAYAIYIAFAYAEDDEETEEEDDEDTEVED